ncbi:hypothetical protein FocTR4_00009699 [Fusarium oxysporum f. sp. cubense]|uniref:Uncharacterized protein n=1 Tax=Fusarium oxysporum f. sp. cubense TaxID=61366 RepID=A0A5C6T7X4_FUSOC|nr:hypothetical protein FocTR4_00009699 [Fusarium oxysporum f. sp. cubense]
MSFFSNANSLPISPNGNQDILVRPELYQQAKVHPSQDPPSHYPWCRLAVTTEDQALKFFFHHYVVPESGRSPTHPDCHGIIYKRATGPGYMANLVSAVGLAGLAYMRNAPTLLNSASQAFSRALHGICAALMDPSEASSDQTLVAVMLLALYELIDCLQRGQRVPYILINLMAEARGNETAQEAPAARLADIIVNVCAVVALAKEGITDEMNLSSYVSALLSIDTDFKDWAQNLPVEYEYKTRIHTSAREERGDRQHMEFTALCAYYPPSGTRRSNIDLLAHLVFSADPIAFTCIIPRPAPHFRRRHKGDIQRYMLQRLINLA